MALGLYFLPTPPKRVAMLIEVKGKVKGIMNLDFCFIIYLLTQAPCLNDMRGQNVLLIWASFCRMENLFFNCKLPSSEDILHNINYNELNCVETKSQRTISPVLPTCGQLFKVLLA